MVDHARPLKELKKKKDFLVGVDSDGCAFDTMEVKHKECFIPNIINDWDLQAVSKYAREVAEFVNLYSVYRGINRFPALIKTFDLLAERPEVIKRKFVPPEISSLRKWVETETRLSNPALEEAQKRTGDPVLAKTLKWSKNVNDCIANLVRGVPPFPYVRESLEKITAYADVIVVSATPGEALVREWEEHDIKKYAEVIAGQEMGNKKEHLAFAKANRYQDDHVLMIGDAPGDLKAARANNVLFYPINPGNEDACWQRFYEEAFDLFLNGKYAGAYEAALISEFEKCLPETPPWKQPALR